MEYHLKQDETSSSTYSGALVMMAAGGRCTAVRRLMVEDEEFDRDAPESGDNKKQVRGVDAFARHVISLFDPKARGERTAQAVCKRAGLGAAYVSNLASRGMPKTIRSYKALADELGVSLAFLVDPENSASGSRRDDSDFRIAIAAMMRQMRETGEVSSITPEAFADACVNLARSLTATREAMSKTEGNSVTGQHSSDK